MSTEHLPHLQSLLQSMPAPESVLFWRPAFGIAVQGSQLTVAVKAQPSSPRLPACG